MEKEILKVINSYIDALLLLDEYDHNSIKEIKGMPSTCKLTYKECRTLIDNMRFKNDSSVFGVEKENGKLEGILEAIYQTYDSKDIYPSLEEKSAHLLYFLIKDHPFVDGCKRIGASIFLLFLHKNDALFEGENKLISSGTLVSLTLLIATSKPEEKDIIIKVIKTILFNKM